MSVIEILLCYWLGANLAAAGAFIVGFRTGGGSVMSAVLCGLLWPFVLLWLLFRVSGNLTERIISGREADASPTRAHMPKSNIYTRHR